MNSDLKLYRNACIWAISISLLCYVGGMVLLFGYDSGSATVDCVAGIAFLVVFLGGEVMSRVAQVTGVDDRTYFFVLLPLGACVANSVIALVIAFVVARMRRRKRTQEDVTRNRSIAGRQSGGHGGAPSAR